jgi:mono/diheme cytochrome c family protein
VLRRFGLVLAVGATIALSAAGCTKGTSSPQPAASVSAPRVASRATVLLAVPGTPALPDAWHGRAIYVQRCAACHGATGAEGGVGPSLQHERARKTVAKIRAWIENPVPPMPKLYPTPLNEADVADVAAYVDTL